MAVTYVQALAQGMYDALAINKRVTVLGSGFGGLAESARAAFAPVYRDFAARVLDVPCSELALAGAAIGAALAGSRPIVCLGTGSFVFQAFPQVVNEAANIHYMTGGQSRVPVTFYSLAGIRGAGGAQHSHSPQGMLGNVPGLQLLLPACPADAYSLMKWALLESENPTWFHSHPLLFPENSSVGNGATPLPVGVARVCRAGTDVTLVASSLMVPQSLRAAARLERERGISAEVIDLRTLAPLDWTTVLRSVQKTGRVVVADECHRSFGAAAELAATLAELAFTSLRAPVRRVTTANVPLPFSPVLEAEVVVSVESIAAAAAGVCAWER